jgi:hypothetical protein
LNTWCFEYHLKLLLKDGMIEYMVS